MDRFRGAVTAIKYFKEETGFGILIADRENEKGTWLGTETIKGIFENEPRIGEAFIFEGAFLQDPKWGRQFEVKRVTPDLPVGNDALRRFLSTDILPHVGVVRAGFMVGKWGNDVLSVIENSPEDLVAIPGITTQRAVEISEAWGSYRGDTAAQLSLFEYGLAQRQIKKISKKFGGTANVVIAVKADPYCLLEVHGMGWKTVDKIGRQNGISADDPRRMRAAAVHLVERFSQDGHTYCPKRDLWGNAVELGISEIEAFKEEVQKLGDRGALVDLGDDVALPRLWMAEKFIAEKIASVTCADEEFSSGMDIIIQEISDDMSLTEEQRAAVVQACMSRVLLITGGPGTGKSYLLLAILRAWKALGMDESEIFLAAPTGRAAVRMKEAANHPACTIHRLLGWMGNPEPVWDGARMYETPFSVNAERPMVGRAVVIDEVSMMDVSLCAHLMRALTASHRIVFVGDADQLPSVGPGAVLRDLEEGGVPSVHLTVIHRQGRESAIVRGAVKVNTGQAPDFPQGGNLELIEVPEGPSMQREIASIVEAISTGDMDISWNGDYCADDIQVLSAVKKGTAGVHDLNTRLQIALNPTRHEVKEVIIGKGEDFRLFRSGDRVMHIKNNYDLRVMNGEIGIMEIADEKILVGYPDGDKCKIVHYERKDLFELVLAYAVTIHKSQGCEFPIVLIPLVRSRIFMRKLVYTAITRARKHCVLVGPKSILRDAVRMQERGGRLTNLGRLLSFEFGGSGEVGNGHDPKGLIL